MNLASSELKAEWAGAWPQIDGLYRALRQRGARLQNLRFGRRRRCTSEMFARGATREDLRSPPVIRRIGIANIRVVLAKGLDDFAAFRDDVVLICVIYPLSVWFWRGWRSVVPR
jgi:hypothetical protein